MKIIKTGIEGLVIIEQHLQEHQNSTETYTSFSLQEFQKKVENIQFVQENESMSTFGVIRGLHYQEMPYTQSKLIRCIKGKILDVALDIRKYSPTYGKHIAIELSGDKHQLFFIPKGFAHGFSVLSENAIIQYKCDNFYHPEFERGINPLDEKLGIDWKIPKDKILMSEKDKKYNILNEEEIVIL